MEHDEHGGRLACEWMVQRRIAAAKESTHEVPLHIVSGEDILDLIARVRADERTKAAGRVERLPRGDSGSWTWVYLDATLAAIREAK